MKTKSNEIMILQHRIQRYHVMRNGAMCQLLNNKIQKILARS